MYTQKCSWETLLLPKESCKAMLLRNYVWLQSVTDALSGFKTCIFAIHAHNFTAPRTRTWSMRFYPPKELRSRGGLHLAERELNAWGRSKYAHRGEVGVEEKPWTTRQQHRPPLVTARCPQQPTSTLAASSSCKSNTRSSRADFRQKGYAPIQGL